MDSATQRGSTEQRRPLLCFSAAFSLAVLASVLLFNGTPWSGLRILLPACVMAGVTMALFPSLRRPVTLAGILAGALWIAGFIWLEYQPAKQYHDRTGSLTFVAESYAVGYGDYGAVDGRLLSIDGIAVDFIVRLYLEDGSPVVEPGDVLSFQGRVALANPELKRGHLARGRYLTVSQKGSITQLSSGITNLTQWGAWTAKSLGDRMSPWLEGDESGLLVALLTGDCTRYSRDFNTALMNSGTSHITAVSGQHISILVTFWVTLFGRKRGLYTVLPLIALFAAVTGFSPSVMRAAIMCGITVLAFVLRREHDTLTALFASLLLLLMVNPFSIVSASLVLSFGSTFGIILFSPMLLAGIRKRMPKGRGIGASILNYTYTTTAASIAALAFTLPLCMLYFTRVSLISAPTTFAALWSASFAMVAGLVVLGISFIWHGAAVFLAKWVLYWPLTYMVRVVKALGAQRWVAAADSIYFAVAAAVLLLVLVGAYRKKLKGAVSIALAVTAFCAFFVLTAVENRIYSDIIIHNTGNSAVMLLRSGDAVTAVNMGGIKGGRSAAFVDDALAAWGISTLDQVVLTSTSYKQSGGLEQALERISAGTILLPKSDGPMPGGDSVQWYERSGALDAGGFTLELIKAAEGRFIPRVLSPGASVLDLCGVPPLEAALALERAGGCDILLIDTAYGQAPRTFERLCRMLTPRLVLLCDDGYTGTFSLERRTTAPVRSLSGLGDITVAQLTH